MSLWSTITKVMIRDHGQPGFEETSQVGKHHEKACLITSPRLPTK
jgi:hypothetical protein